jgi:hypothetical protein
MSRLHIILIISKKLPYYGYLLTSTTYLVNYMVSTMVSIISMAIYYGYLLTSVAIYTMVNGYLKISPPKRLTEGTLGVGLVGE